MTSTFDYKGFAKNLTKQAEGSMPDDIALEHKKEFLERIYNFTYIAGEAFSNDENIDNSDTAKLLTQVISEWTFHKYIDLLRSDIPALYHDSILQKLGYVAYEMTREATVGKLSQEEMLNLVEVQLNRVFEQACQNLCKNGQITKDMCESALKQSNIDLMPILSKKLPKLNTFYYTVTALVFALYTLSMNVFYYEYEHLDVLNTVAIVALSMYIGFYIGVKKFGR